MEKESKSSGYLREILQWIQAIIFAVVISLLIRGFVFERVLVDGPSMEHTLTTGDNLILYKLGYYFSPPKRGDIVVLQVNEGVIGFLPFLKNVPFFKKALPDLTEIDYIKRVVGVPGDTVEFKDGKVYVNGSILNETYAEGPTYGSEGKTKIEKNKVYVLGDNRLDSRDSREIGMVDFDKIRGKAILRIWPFRHAGSIYRN